MAFTTHLLLCSVLKSLCFLSSTITHKLEFPVAKAETKARQPLEAAEAEAAAEAASEGAAAAAVEAPGLPAFVAAGRSCSRYFCPQRPCFARSPSPLSFSQFKIRCTCSK